MRLLKAHAVGILFLGFLGYVVRLIHIPVNNIIVNV
jgi:preprotein translocase subunit Sss1